MPIASTKLLFSSGNCWLPNIKEKQNKAEKNKPKVLRVEETLRSDVRTGRGEIGKSQFGGEPM
jgi:hypothetical protein